MDWPAGLIGRSGELAEMGSALARLGDGAALAIDIVGEPGAGKTALLEAALAAAGARGSTVLRVGSSPAEQDTSWSALGSLVGQIPQALVGALSEEQRIALDVALGQRLGRAADVAPAVSSSLRELFVGLCEESTVVMGVDDAHWLDAASASAIAVALRTLPTAPIALICTRCPGATPIDLARLFGDRLTVVAPGALRRSDLQQILRSQGITVTSAMLDDVDTLAAGNPLHAHLLAEQIARHGWRAGHLPVSLSIGFAEVFDAPVRREQPGG